MSRWGRIALAVAAMTAVVLGGTATPAQAREFRCEDRGFFPSVWCYVPYQTYPYGQTTGLRSSMAGYPDYGITATQQSGSDEIRIQLKVWDLNTDGYRARVWIDIFQGCWCVDSSRHVAPTQDNTQGATRVFDAYISSGQVSSWPHVNSAGTTTASYTVRLRLGRYQGSTGLYQWGEDQLYYLTVYRL
jgi:hypothetical protein